MRVTIVLQLLVLSLVIGCRKVALYDEAINAPEKELPAAGSDQNEAPTAPAPTELTPELPPYPTGIDLIWKFQDGTRWDAEYMGHQDGKVWLRRHDDQSIVELPITDLDESSRRVIDEPAWMLRLARNLLRIHEPSRPAEWHAAEHVFLLERTRIPLETRVALTEIQTRIAVKERDLLKATEDQWVPLAHELAKLKIDEERLSRQGFDDAMAKAKARMLLYETVGIDEKVQRLRMTVELIENNLLTPDDVTRFMRSLAVARIKAREMPADVRATIDLAVALLEKHLKELPEYDQALRRISDLEQSLMTSRLRISRQRLDELREQAGQKLDELGMLSEGLVDKTTPKQTAETIDEGVTTQNSSQKLSIRERSVRFLLAHWTLRATFAKNVIPSSGLGDQKTPLLLQNAISIVSLNGYADTALCYARLMALKPYLASVESVGKQGSIETRAKLMASAFVSDLEFAGLILPAGTEWYENSATLKLDLAGHFSSQAATESIAEKVVKAERLATTAAPKDQLIKWFKEIIQSHAERDDVTVQAMQEAESKINTVLIERGDVIAQSVAVFKEVRSKQEPVGVRVVIEELLDQDQATREALAELLGKDENLLPEPLAELRAKALSVGR